VHHSLHIDIQFLEAHLLMQFVAVTTRRVAICYFVAQFHPAIKSHVTSVLDPVAASSVNFYLSVN